MKCKHCDGNGGYLDMNRWCFCEQCDGTGQDGLSNEEYLRSCNTEQLAEFLCNVGFENETIIRKFKSEWVKWLKEKHDESM